MSSKKLKVKSKTPNGQWSDRLRGSSPGDSSEAEDPSAADQPCESSPFTLEELGVNLQPRIKEALCSDEVLEKIKGVIMEAITEKVTQEVYSSISMDLSSIREEQKSMKENIKKMEENLDTLKASIDDQEQYSRRECLRFYGVPEKSTENTDDVIRDIASKQLNVPLSEKDIARCHRITPKGGRKGENPNPIIVRFVSYNVRRRVYEAKTKLKGSNIFVQEDLTARRRELLNKARKLSTVKRVCTSDGRITAWRTTPDGKEKKVLIRNASDLALLE